MQKGRSCVPSGHHQRVSAQTEHMSVSKTLQASLHISSEGSSVASGDSDRLNRAKGDSGSGRCLNPFGVWGVLKGIRAFIMSEVL
jgi:hypothetical protein